MRILFIIFRDQSNPSAVGGDIYLWELARCLSNLGNQVTVLCSSFHGARDMEKVNGVELLRIKGLWSLPFKIGQVYFKKLKGKFDVVIEEAIGGQRFPFFSSLYVKEPLVAVWHQRNTTIFREQYSFPIATFLSFLEYFQARVYRNRMIITPSKSSKEEVLGLGFKKDRVSVVYDGVGDIFANVPISSKRDSLIVWLGKLRRYKHPDHAILALPQILKASGSDCKLVIAGKISEFDKSYIYELRNLCEKIRVASNVEFRFNISEAEKLELLRQASVLVQPSPIEGFSIVVIEANRCGTPVVVSDGVPSDVVRDGHNGIVYSYGDIDALSADVSKLLVDRELWEKMSRLAYLWSQKFTWKSATIELQKVLARLIAKETGVSG